MCSNLLCHAVDSRNTSSSVHGLVVESCVVVRIAVGRFLLSVLDQEGPSIPVSSSVSADLETVALVAAEGCTGAVTGAVGGCSGVAA